MCLLAITVGINTKAQSGEGYYGPVTSTGSASHAVGTGSNAFSVFATATYATLGGAIDNFVGPNGVAGSQEITGEVAPQFAII